MARPNPLRQGKSRKSRGEEESDPPTPGGTRKQDELPGLGPALTAIVLVTGRKLSEKYPQGKVVMLLAWSDEPLLFLGDAESVFLARSDCR